jgi:transcriptional regulator with XRE-family HTH domain
MDKALIQPAIAAGLQKLRKERRVTQSELAESLGLSQSQLSKIENGQGSLTAEQLVWLLQNYSLSLGYFVAPENKAKPEENSPLQNALVNLGASHLRTVPGVAIPERLESPETAIVETLIEGSSRLITALAPVIARQCEKINLQRIAQQLRTYAFGAQYRIWWVVDGTYQALGGRLNEPYLPSDLHRLYQKAFLLLERKKLDVGHVQEQLTDQEDELDQNLISERTIQLVKQNRDKLAHHWHIVTRIKKSGFEQALKDSEEK